MSRVILLLLLLSCVGCGSSLGTGYFPYEEPGMRFELLENNGWSILAETRETWIPHKGIRALLQEYFPLEYIGFTPTKFNFFYATYLLDGGEELALLVNLPFSFARSASNCAKPKLQQMICISTNTPHVSFDNDSTYLLINQLKVIGSEIRYKIMKIEDMPAYDHRVHDLSSAETVANRQPDEVVIKRLPFPTFYFRFPVSCRELENAVFVIDGFTMRDGKRLPPLKVRMNYYDFDMVPALQGEQALMRK